jgi:hypothetical protein
MSGWLYDPKNDYIGKIFWTDEDYAAAVADGWETAPYPAERREEKVKTPVVFENPSQPETKEPPVVINRRKPGRKKQG